MWQKFESRVKIFFLLMIWGGQKPPQSLENLSQAPKKILCFGATFDVAFGRPKSFLTIWLPPKQYFKRPSTLYQTQNRKEEKKRQRSRVTTVEKDTEENQLILIRAMPPSIMTIITTSKASHPQFFFSFFIFPSYLSWS